MSDIKTNKYYVRRSRRVPTGDDVVTTGKYKSATAYADEIECITQKTTEDSDYEQRRVNSLLHVIFKICELSGYWVEGRIVLKDRKTGKIWR